MTRTGVTEIKDAKVIYVKTVGFRHANSVTNDHLGVAVHVLLVSEEINSQYQQSLKLLL